MENKDLKYLNTPIGVFDSGVGGLSVLKELEKLAPKEDYIYYGDTKNLPYGDKTPKDIINFGKNTFEFFIKHGVKHVVMACNTSSALAYEQLEKTYGINSIHAIKIYPIIQIAAQEIAKHNVLKGGKIGIMATPATVKSSKYTDEILKNNSCADVYEIACDNFVKIVENRLYDDENSVAYIREILDVLLKVNVEKIVLGCTHYPYLMPILTKFASEEIFIDPAVIFSKCVIDDVKKDAKPVQGEGKREFYVSASPDRFKENAKFFRSVDMVNLVGMCS